MNKILTFYLHLLFLIDKGLYILLPDLLTTPGVNNFLPVSVC